MFDRESISKQSRAAFYAALWPELREAAAGCGWALGLHGSIKSDMDIIAMPWVDGASDIDELMQCLIGCFNPKEDMDYSVDYESKPNNRVVYTIPIWSDFYLDINIINTDK